MKLDREVLANVAVKNVLQPALLLAAGLALGLRGTLLQEVFLIGVLPSGTLVPALAHNNKAYENEAPLTSMASTLFSIVSIGAGIRHRQGGAVTRARHEARWRPVHELPPAPSKENTHA